MLLANQKTIFLLSRLGNKIVLRQNRRPHGSRLFWHLTVLFPENLWSYEWENNLWWVKGVGVGGVGVGGPTDELVYLHY